jgi:peptidyl-prolyl cis-trans isomerase SurA
MMKKIILLVGCVFVLATTHAQTLFTYGNNSVDKQEFLKAYNKNKTTVPNKEAALKEYLDLYAKFKLKVKAAADLKLDTLPQLKYDVLNFKNQISENYMMDDVATTTLTNEAISRSQKDIHVLHFYIGLDTKMKPEDTAKAYKAMNEVYEEIKEGKNNYDEMVEDISKTIIPIKGIDAGFITAFTVPYEFESIIYNLKLGEANKPYRSKKGLHVFRKIDERKSVGKWKIAQILLSFPPGEQSTFFKPIENKADSIYKKLLQGADFAEMAKLFSDDKLTYLNGGEMPEFGTGKFDYPYEKEVFKIAKNGDVAKPFFTEYGFHIIKRLNQTPTPEDKNDATFFGETKQKVLQDGRIETAKNNFTKKIINQIGYKKNTLVKDAELFKYADSVSLNANANRITQYPISNKNIFSFASKTNIKASDWLNFVKDYKNNPSFYKGENNATLLNKYVGITAQEFYKNAGI